MNYRAVFGIVFLILLSNVAWAIPGFPHLFYGDVKINGKAASDNQVIEARIDGQTVESGVTKNGAYGYNPTNDDPIIQFYVRDPDNNREGDTIEFFVNDKKAGEFTFSNGDQTRLDLSITVSGGSSSSSGGSKKSSSSSSPMVVVTSSNVTNDTDISDDTSDDEIVIVTSNCEPNWICSGWEDCIEGKQVRTCADANICNDATTKPNEVQDCELPKKQEEKRDAEAKNPTAFDRITGAFLGNGTAVGGTIVVIVILAGILIYFFRFRKQKATKKSKK